MRNALALAIIIFVNAPGLHRSQLPPIRGKITQDGGSSTSNGMVVSVSWRVAHFKYDQTNCRVKAGPTLRGAKYSLVSSKNPKPRADSVPLWPTKKQNRFPAAGTIGGRPGSSHPDKKKRLGSGPPTGPHKKQTSLTSVKHPRRCDSRINNNRNVCRRASLVNAKGNVAFGDGWAQ